MNNTESTEFVEDLGLNSRGTVQISAVDNVGNVGEASAATNFETVQLEVVGENNADSMDNVTADGNWDIMDVDGRTVFTDSPSGNYSKILKQSFS